MSDDFLPPIVAVLKGDIRNFTMKMDEATGEMKAVQEESGSTGKGLAKGVGMGLMAVGGAAVAVGALAIGMADKYEQAHARLDTVTRNSGERLSAFNGLLKKQEDHYSNLGVDMTQYESALSMLVPVTGGVEKANKLLSVAMDLAVARHMDLEKAAVLVGKVYQGNTTILKRMGIDLGIASGGVQKQQKAEQALQAAVLKVQRVEADVARGKLKGVAATRALQDAYAKLTGAQSNLNAAQDAGALGVDALRKKFHGAADEMAGTDAGKVAALNAKFHNLMTELGLKLQPILITVLSKFNDLVTWYTSKGEPMFKRWGATLEDDVIAPADHLAHAIWNSAIGGAINSLANGLAGLITDAANFNRSFMSQVGGGIADVFGLGSGPNDTNAIYANNDRKMGWAPGTTAARIKNHVATKVVQNVSGPGGHAAGGAAVAGLPYLAGEFGPELITSNRPTQVTPRNRLSGGSGGTSILAGAHISLTVVSPDPKEAGVVVLNTLTDAAFLSERA